jgi:hypothetical protein
MDFKMSAFGKGASNDCQLAKRRQMPAPEIAKDSAPEPIGWLAGFDTAVRRRRLPRFALRQSGRGSASF